MAPLDPITYERNVFEAIVGLIQKRDPSLAIDEAEGEARNLMSKHVRTAPMAFPTSDQPRLTQEEWMRLQEQARTLADSLRNLSFESQIELRYLCKPLPDLSRLHLDLADFSSALQRGLKKRPAAKNHRPKDLVKEDLVDEAIAVFEMARGIRLADLSNPKSHKNKIIRQELNDFVEIYIADRQVYSSRSALNRYMSRHLKNRHS
jgi:hypothetical protein